MPAKRHSVDRHQGRNGERAAPHPAAAVDLGAVAMPFANRPPGTHWSDDPEYKRNRRLKRRQAAAAAEPCTRCGGPIDYQAKTGPQMWHCGHILDRARGGGHELSNMQSECGRCSVTSGAKLGAERRWAGQRKSTQRPATAARW